MFTSLQGGLHSLFKPRSRCCIPHEMMTLATPLRSSFSLYLLLVGLTCCCIACTSESVPTGAILVKNDSLDSSYNVITVSGGGTFASLRPSERVILPKGTTTFSVERRYKDYTRSYSVQCPPHRPKGIAIKLIDIHVNKMPGGCKTVFARKQ